ncbi:MAG: type II toxin-antitoxin system HicB family antitoxin [Chloroflexi bacterium]|nr:type II toxin-antitoxin system HicB family antitoxin [Chloroflexota bacterium]
MIYAYPCQLTPDEDGGFVVTFRDVPEAITGGSDYAEALAMAEDALATALAGYVQEEWEIPMPSGIEDGDLSVAVPSVVAAKLALYSAMKAQRVSGADLAHRLGISEAAVRKMANPDDRSDMDRVQQALRELGHRLKVEVTAA